MKWSGVVAFCKLRPAGVWMSNSNGFGNGWSLKRTARHRHQSAASTPTQRWSSLYLDRLWIEEGREEEEDKDDDDDDDDGEDDDDSMDADDDDDAGVLVSNVSSPFVVRVLTESNGLIEAE